MMQSSYRPEDVTLLLKDISGLVQPLSAKEREQFIQSGTHYCEMLPLEYIPSDKYLQAYAHALAHEADHTAAAVRICAEKILAAKGKHVVLVSLARAGLPIGILLRWYFQRFHGLDVPHYGISIIRGRGIDHNAMQYLLNRYPPECLQFVDGWIGKGAILQTLTQVLSAYPRVSPTLAVLSDPANLTTLCGTHEDFLIPSSCLNSTVSGLISRTFLRADLIGPQDFHGAAFYPALRAQDVSYDFLHTIAAHFSSAPDIPACILPHTGMEEVLQIAKTFGISDVNLIKPGIGETTRVLLRRIPWKVFVQTGLEHDPALSHLYQLAQEKGVPVESFPLRNYKACGIIAQLADM